MSSLLNESTYEQAQPVLKAIRQRRLEALRVNKWGEHGEETPAGLVRLHSPEDKATFGNYMMRNARQEQRGNMPGETSTQALEHPNVQAGIDEIAAERQGGPPSG